MLTLTWPLPGIDNSVATHGGVVAYRAGVMEPLQVVLVCVKTCSACCIIDSSCKWASGSCWLASFVNQHWCGKEHQGSCAGVSQPAYFNIPFFHWDYHFKGRQLCSLFVRDGFLNTFNLLISLSLSLSY